MDWFGAKKQPATPDKKAPAAAPTPAAEAAKEQPSSPPKAAAGVTQAGIANREADELASILSDSKTLRDLAANALQADTLESTETLEQLSELSQRLLCRNRSRMAAAKFGHALLNSGGGSTADASVEAAAQTFMPAYFRHTTEGSSEEEGGQTDLWVAKVFLHALPAAPEGTTLCARFSLSRVDGGEEEPLYDLTLKLMQIAPFDAGATKYSLSFALADVTSAAAAEWLLDESQRSKLSVLQGLLGLKGRFTPAGVLGIVFAGCGCGQLEENACFGEVLRAAKEAHREELLAASGSLF